MEVDRDVNNGMQIKNFSGNIKNEQLGSSYSKGTFYGQIKSQFNQSPTNQYMGVVNNQPYQQTNYQKKSYLQSPQNFSLNDNKYSQNISDSQNPSMIQKTLMFSKSKEKIIG